MHPLPSWHCYRITTLTRDLAQYRFWVKCSYLPAVGSGGVLTSLRLVFLTCEVGWAWQPPAGLELRSMLGTELGWGSSCSMPIRCLPDVHTETDQGSAFSCTGTFQWCWRLGLPAIMGIKLRPLLRITGLPGRREESRAEGQSRAAAVSALFVQKAGHAGGGGL